MDDIRIGYISSLSETRGMVRVTYPDRDRAVTAEIPYFNHNGEYFMPRINDMVLVAHVSNDQSMAIALGTFWNREDMPKVSGINCVNKPLDHEGVCFVRQQDGSVIIADSSGQVTVSDILNMRQRIERLEAGGGE